MEVAIAILFVVGFIGGLIWLAFYFDRKRTEAITRFAQEHGYQVDPGVADFLAAASGFKLFSVGRSRIAKNLIRGQRNGEEFALADYQYTTGGGKNSHTYFQTVCMVRASRVTLPLFALRRQIALFDFLGKVFGGQDINFDSDPTFSKAFVLQTTGDEHELRSRFDEQVRMAFVELAAKGVQAESKGDTLLVHYARRLGTERFNELIEDTLRIRGLFRS